MGAGLDVPVVVPAEVTPVGSAGGLAFGLIPGFGDFAVVVGVLMCYRRATA
jgi:hypothetical protein